MSPSIADPEMKSIRLASQFSSITRRWLYTLCPSWMTRPVCWLLLFRHPATPSLWAAFHSILCSNAALSATVEWVLLVGMRQEEHPSRRAIRWQGQRQRQRFRQRQDKKWSLVFGVQCSVRFFSNWPHLFGHSMTSGEVHPLGQNGLFEIFQAAAYL